MLPGFPLAMGGNVEMTPQITLTAGNGDLTGGDFSSWKGFTASRSGKSTLKPQAFGSLSAEPLPGALCNSIASTLPTGGANEVVEFSGNVLEAISKWKFIWVNGVAYPVNFTFDGANTTYAALNQSSSIGMFTFAAGTAYAVSFST